MKNRTRYSNLKNIERVVSIFYNEKLNLPAAIVYNGGAIPQMPDDIAVEVPVTEDGAGVHKTIIENLPEGIIGMLSVQVSPQRMSVHAVVNGSKELALQALLCEPTINSTSAAEKINDELFEINKKYIKMCI